MLSVPGIGSGPSVTRVMPRRARARPISRAMNGLPSDSAWIRRSVGPDSAMPSRVLRRRCSAGGPRPLTGSTSVPKGARARSSGGSAPVSAARCAHSRPIPSRSSLRNANPTADPVGASSHWLSSMTTNTGAEAARTSSAVRNAAAITPGSGASCGASSISNAAPSARRCGGGSAGSTTSSREPSRSARPAKASRRSPGAGSVRRII